ncbi:uncharacterized protein LOC135126252 [Zophobas morio]|uniref:uncharacterized protein LOC135126252 n=1 Tax=Zophobas morio TaxID=2755281 RepID=UPI003082F19A
MRTLIPLRTQQDLPTLNFNEISLFKDVEVGNSTNLRNLKEEFSNSVLINSDQDIDSDVEFIGKVYIEGDMELSGTVNEVETNSFVTTNTDQELSAIYNFKSKVNLDQNLLVDGLVNGIDIDKWAQDSVKVVSQFPQNISNSWSVDPELILEEDSTGNGLINNIDFKKFSQEIQDKRNHKYQVEEEFIENYINICKDLTYMHDKLKKQIYKFDYLEKLQTLNFHKKVEYIYNYFYRNATYFIVNEKSNCLSYLFIFDSRFRYIKDIHFGPIAQIVSVRSNDLLYLVIRNQPFYSTCKTQGTNLWQLKDDNFENLLNIEDQDLLQESLEPGTFYGLRKHVITEYKILPNLASAIRYRKWEVREDNMAFVPRGLATGLSLRTGKKLINLHRDYPTSDSFSPETEEIIIATTWL